MWQMQKAVLNYLISSNSKSCKSYNTSCVIQNRFDLNADFMRYSSIISLKYRHH